MSTPVIKSLSVQADQAQSEALDALCFADLMTHIIRSYKLQQAIANIVFTDDPAKLKEELDLWQRMIDVSTAALNANQSALLKAQSSSNPDAVLAEDLDAFIKEHQPGFELFVSEGDWWADVAY